MTIAEVTKLDDEQVSIRLAELNEGLEETQQWALANEKLNKTFLFKDFIHAFGWMSKLAIYAEKVNHHPEWFNVYNKVTVQLTTHDVNGISTLDFDMAKMMETCA